MNSAFTARDLSAMADKADVRSLAQIEAFWQQLAVFRTQLSAEIEALLMELRRLTNWLNNDVLGYWSDEVVKAERRWTECRDNLSRCMSYVREDERRPCTEEKKRLQIAEQRLELCQQKLKVTRSAILFWETERSKQQAKIAHCRDLAEGDLQVAYHVLADQVARLQNYANLRSPSLPANSQPDSNVQP
jgi:hypothetical protein